MNNPGIWTHQEATALLREMGYMDEARKLFLPYSKKREQSYRYHGDPHDDDEWRVWLKNIDDPEVYDYWRNLKISCANVVKAQNGKWKGWRLNSVDPRGHSVTVGARSAVVMVPGKKNTGMDPVMGVSDWPRGPTWKMCGPEFADDGSGRDFRGWWYDPSQYNGG
jgi:hypothetical protein